MIVYLAGSAWQDVAGTDRHLASALAAHEPVLWVDPPLSVVRSPRLLWHRSPRLDAVARGVVRLRVVAPPGVTRPLMRSLAGIILGRSIRAALRRLGEPSELVVLAGPTGRFPAGVPGRRLLYLTDDWVAGAELMGLSRRWVARRTSENGRRADVVVAVTPDLAGTMSSLMGRDDIHVLPNGVRPPVELVVESDTAPGSPRLAGLIGQLNERLDLDALEAVSARGIEILVVGPRWDREETFRRRLDAFLASPTVNWLGGRPPEEIPAHLATIAVGLTPYVDNAFNRASFPLKTLEYLAAGCAVVASESPATRWLDTDLVEVAKGPEDFAAKVQYIIEGPDNQALRDRRKAFAAKHTWGVRASALLELVQSSSGLRAGKPAAQI